MADIRPGDSFGRYRIETEIGRGGMGTVYAAMDERIGRRVALKVISLEVSHQQSFRRRFLREMRIAARSEHVNIVPVYEVGTLGDRLFITMRCIDGPDLAGVVMHGGPLRPQRLARIALMLGAALDAAHADGLVHRDVKPANVLIGEPGEGEHAYLTDFGLARELASDSGLTGSGQWMGTADFISPEQLNGSVIDARADLYSMSCLLFHALTGRLPYAGTVAAKLKGHLMDPLQSVGDAIEHHEAIDAVLARGAAKDPAQRFPSAGDLARAIDAAIAGEHSVARERSVATGAALSGIERAREEQPRMRSDSAPAPPRPPRAVAVAARVLTPYARRIAAEAAATTARLDRRRLRRPRVLLAVFAAVTLAGLALAASDDAPTPRARVVAAVPGREIVAQFGAFNEVGLARTRAAEMGREGLAARVLYADRYVLDPKIRIPHLWIVVSRGGHDRAAAEKLRRRSGEVDAVIRTITPRRSAKRPAR